MASSLDFLEDTITCPDCENQVKVQLVREQPTKGRITVDLLPNQKCPCGHLVSEDDFPKIDSY